MPTRAELMNFAQVAVREVETLRKKVAAIEKTTAELMKENSVLKAQCDTMEHELQTVKQNNASKKKARKQSKSSAQQSVASEHDTAVIESATTVNENSANIVADQPHQDSIIDSGCVRTTVATTSMDTEATDVTTEAPVTETTLMTDANDDCVSADSKTECDVNTSTTTITTSSGTPSPKKTPKKKNSKKGKASKKASTPPPAPQSTEPSAPIEDSAQKKRLEMDSNERKMDRRQRMKEMKAQREKFNNDVGALRFLLQVAERRNLCELGNHCGPGCTEHGSDACNGATTETSPMV